MNAGNRFHDVFSSALCITIVDGTAQGYIAVLNGNFYFACIEVRIVGKAIVNLVEYTLVGAAISFGTFAPMATFVYSCYGIVWVMKTGITIVVQQPAILIAPVIARATTEAVQTLVVLRIAIVAAVEFIRRAASVCTAVPLISVATLITTAPV